MRDVILVFRCEGWGGVCEGMDSEVCSKGERKLEAGRGKEVVINSVCGDHIQRWRRHRLTVRNGRANV
jgi:hypothetical protein